MTLCDNAADFRALLPAKGSLLALDVSKRRIGIAGTDQERRLATPVTTIERRGAAADLDRLAADGTRARRGRAGDRPADQHGRERGPDGQGDADRGGALAARLGLPALLQDERLSTFAVEDAIAEGRLPRPRKGQPVDHYAAMVILEDALQALHQ